VKQRHADPRPTLAQRRLLGNLIVGGMIVRRNFLGESLHGPPPALEFVYRLNARMLEEMIAFGWLERVDLGVWTVSPRGRQVFDSGKLR
jgi:hypothetical protein